MDITYGCMDIWLWLKFMTESVDVIDYVGINPYIIIEFADYVHAYMFDDNIWVNTYVIYYIYAFGHKL